MKNTDFTFTAPSNLVYTGQALTIDKSVTTTLTTGTITEKYYKNGTGEGLMQVVDAGIYTVKIDVAGSDNYKLATAITGEGESVWTFTVDKATLKNTDFTFTAPTDLVYTGQALTIDKPVTTALTTGTITEKYYKDGTGEGLMQVVDAGIYTVKIDVAGSDNYKLATAITGEGESVWTFTVDKATLKNTDFTFTAPTDLVYTGQALTIDKSVTTALTTGEITEKYYKDGTGDGLTQVIDAGTYTVKIDVAESDNYKLATAITGEGESVWTFTVDKATLKNTDFTFTAPSNLVYTGQALTIDKSVTTTLTTGEITEKYYKDGTGEGLMQVIDAGTYTVKISVAESDNYNEVTDDMTDDSWTFAITPKEITVTPDADQVFFNEGKDATITYTHADFADADKEDAGKVAFDGALAFEMQSGNTYKIINPIDGGLSLTGTSANNYSLKFTDNVIATVYTEVAEDVTARLPDPLAINENGWVKVAAYPVVLTLPDIPAGFSFTDDNGSDPVTEFTISSDGEHVYYLKHSSMSAVFMHSLWTDATAPSIPATADEGSITTTTATFTLADATSGIASYTVTENGTEISAWPQLKAAVPGETSLVYTYTGRPGSSHTLTFEVTDMAGNTATSDVAFTLKSDYVPPVPSYYDIYLESSDSVRLSSGSTVVEEGYSFTFTAEVAEGYDPATLTVEYKRGRNGNWQALEAESNGKYRIRSVYDDIYVRAAVRPSGDPTAMDRVEDGKSRIRTLGNRICITADRPVDMRVVSIEGRVVRAERLPAGYSEVGGMPDGIYIVLLSDGTRSKVVIR